MNFSAKTSDPDGDQLYYLWDWGDNTTSDWLGPYNSGEEIIASHSWSDEGVYEIKVKAKDANGAESEWSNPFMISVSKIYFLRNFFIEKIPSWLELTFGNMLTKVFQFIIYPLMSYYLYLPININLNYNLNQVSPIRLFEVRI